jgi:hypothetical protein
MNIVKILSQHCLFFAYSLTRLTSGLSHWERHIRSASVKPTLTATADDQKSDPSDSSDARPKQQTPASLREAKARLAAENANALASAANGTGLVGGRRTGMGAGRMGGPIKCVQSSVTQSDSQSMQQIIRFHPKIESIFGPRICDVLLIVFSKHMRYISFSAPYHAYFGHRLWTSVHGVPLNVSQSPTSSSSARCCRSTCWPPTGGCVTAHCCARGSPLWPRVLGRRFSMSAPDMESRRGRVVHRYCCRGQSSCIMQTRVILFLKTHYVFPTEQTRPKLGGRV